MLILVYYTVYLLSLLLCSLGCLHLNRRTYLISHNALRHARNRAVRPKLLVETLMSVFLWCPMRLFMTRPNTGTLLRRAVINDMDIRKIMRLPPPQKKRQLLYQLVISQAFRHMARRKVRIQNCLYFYLNHKMNTEYKYEKLLFFFRKQEPICQFKHYIRVWHLKIDK